MLLKFEIKLPKKILAIYLPYIILINKNLNDYEKSIAIIHETVHHNQFLNDKLFHVKYVFSKVYKLKKELEAYAVEIIYKLDITHKSQFSTKKYNKILWKYVKIISDKYTKKYNQFEIWEKLIIEIKGKLK